MTKKPKKRKKEQLTAKKIVPFITIWIEFAVALLALIHFVL